MVGGVAVAAEARKSTRFGRRCAATLVTLLATLAPLAQAFAPAEEERLRARVEALAAEPRIATTVVADPWLLAQLYAERQFQPVWTDEAVLRELVDALGRAAERHGLNPADFHLEVMREALDAGLQRLCCAELDLLATDAVARLMFQLTLGKLDPESFHASWNFRRAAEGASPVQLVEALLGAEDLPAALEALAPQTPAYRGLVDALAWHRRLAAAGGWPSVADGPTLRAGERDPRVGELRRRLAAGEDLTGADAELKGPDAEFFDGPLDAAVRRFQARHGLAVDGLVGPRTLAALNVPVAARIDQLRVNLERHRWLGDEPDGRYLLVNIASYRVVLVEAGEVTWETRAVVGLPYRQTPVFRADMRYLVFNPTWTVPPVILARDLLPELRRDPAALERRNMEVLDLEGRRVDPAEIDWAQARPGRFPYLLRQRPGPDNALGRVKFMYPNPWHVYMHDTPHRDLFGHTERTFSSGCVRLEQPLELAERLLAGTAWDRAAMAAVLAEGRPRTVHLPEPVPVLTIYATAVAEAGRVLFLPDVYARDARILASLDAPPVAQSSVEREGPEGAVFGEEIIDRAAVGAQEAEVGADQRAGEPRLAE